jgi:hypothetical protein
VCIFDDSIDRMIVCVYALVFNSYYTHIILSFYNAPYTDFGDGHDVEANIPGMGTFLLKSQYLKKSSSSK